MTDLFAAAGVVPSSGVRQDVLGPGALMLRGWRPDLLPDLLDAVRRVVSIAPFRQMQTPGGHTMSVAMTSCGDFGWITDRRGYRYSPQDPQSGLPWPAMPPVLEDFAAAAAENAGYPAFRPDSCLINCYAAGAKMALHQDRDEADLTQPIVSVSLGLPAIFLWGGLARSDRARRVALAHGDCVIWGGASRLVYHGIAPLKAGDHPATGAARLNLTFRKAMRTET